MRVKPSIRFRYLLLLLLPLLITLPILLIWSPRPIADRAEPLATIPALTDRGDLGSLQVPQEDAVISQTGYTSARVCGTCHVDIYTSWKNSLHAFSLADPIFDASFMLALKEGGEKARELCLRCHAPMTMVNGDYDLSEGVTNEGVSCDFCHTVKRVHLDGRDKPYEIELGITKRSVLRHAESPAHEAEYSELHGTAEFCGGCHNFWSATKAPLMGTYQEWLDGPYSKEGIQCQDCHMERSVGSVVSADLMPSTGTFHLHSLIHDNDQLRSALSVQILDSVRDGDYITADIEIENVGSGHMVPTGIPTREIILTVKAESEGQQTSKDRSYKKVVSDAEGRILTSDHEILLRGMEIVSDTRFRPREKRIERIRLKAPTAGVVHLSAVISYRYTPSILRSQPMSLEIGRSEKYVPPLIPLHMDPPR